MVRRVDYTTGNHTSFARHGAPYLVPECSSRFTREAVVGKPDYKGTHGIISNRGMLAVGAAENFHGLRFQVHSSQAEIRPLPNAWSLGYMIYPAAGGGGGRALRGRQHLRLPAPVEMPDFRDRPTIPLCFPTYSREGNGSK